MLVHAGARKIYLLGDATHGTHEFYRFRQQVTRELIDRFSADHLVLELGTDEAAAVDRWLQRVADDPDAGGAGGADRAPFVLQTSLRRWPRWIWANHEVAVFLDWLQRLNTGRLHDDRVRILGMDLQGTGSPESMQYEELNQQDPYAAWNYRARYMASRIAAIVEAGGRPVVWAHNNHVGDKAADDVRGTGLISVGQLLRQRFGREEVFILGSAGYQGHFVAAEQWQGGPYRAQMDPALPGSAADLLARTDWANPLLYWESETQRAQWDFDVYHRGIGVVHAPAGDDLDTYVLTRISRRYDALVFFRQTHALRPLSGNLNALPEQ